jgi:hypothetical protein
MEAKMKTPRRIVLSRKGFDSTARYGGRPSPIFDDGRILSLPIPEDTKKTIKYSALLDPTEQFPSLGSIVEQLTKGKLTGDSFVHLDPDLRANSVAGRMPDWRPIFDQVDQAQTHLCNQGVGKGDLFLFYGLYRETTVRGTKINYVRDSLNKHVSDP